MATITVTNLRTSYEQITRGNAQKGKLTVKGVLPDGLRRNTMDPEILIEDVECLIAEQYNQTSVVTIDRIRDTNYLCLTIQKDYERANEIPADTDIFVSRLTGGESVQDFKASVLDAFHKGLVAAQRASK